MMLMMMSDLHEGRKFWAFGFARVAGAQTRWRDCDLCPSANLRSCTDLSDTECFPQGARRGVEYTTAEGGDRYSRKTVVSGTSPKRTRFELRGTFSC